MHVALLSLAGATESLPDVTLVVCNMVLLEKCDELLRERYSAMMFFLLPNDVG
jgi:hypothetical protein